MLRGLGWRFQAQLLGSRALPWDRIGGMNDAPRTFSEFWPHYVLAHRHPATRIFHLAGTLLGWAIFLAAIFLLRPWLLLAALAVPYALAWFSHFFIERNRPATFGHPLWSWLADQKMVAMVLAGRMEGEVKRCGALGGPAAST